MSNKFNKNEKELAGVVLVPATQVWVQQKNGKYRLRNDLDIVGKIDMNMPNMVLSANQVNKPTRFVDDVTALSKRTKKEIVSHFFDNNGARNKKTVAYLVRTDAASKTSEVNRVAIKPQKRNKKSK